MSRDTHSFIDLGRVPLLMKVLLLDLFLVFCLSRDVANLNTWRSWTSDDIPWNVAFLVLGLLGTILLVRNIWTPHVVTDSYGRAVFINPDWWRASNWLVPGNQWKELRGLPGARSGNLEFLTSHPSYALVDLLIAAIPLLVLGGGKADHLATDAHQQAQLAVGAGIPVFRLASWYLAGRNPRSLGGGEAADDAVTGAWKPVATFFVLFLLPLGAATWLVER